ncbi:MAG: hypothetical protein ACREGH_01125 [Minisyncoccia bacterium]
MQEGNEKKILSAEDAVAILSETLQEVALRRTTLRRALVVSRLAVALAKVIEVVDLKDRVELLEQVLKRKKTK